MLKRNLQEYEIMIANLDDEQLHKELWLLDTHILFLKKQNPEEANEISEILKMHSIVQNEIQKRYS